MKKIVLIGALVVAFQITYAQITLIPKAGLTSSIMIDLRYAFGMTDLYDLKGVDISIKNRVLQLTVGMPLVLKK